MTGYFPDWAVITPLANEAAGFPAFAAAVSEVMNRIGGGKVYLVVDAASQDNTRELVENLAAKDSRFVAVWAPENRHVVDAYLRGLREAYHGHALIIEMDAGLSHDPRAIPMFLRVLDEGNECAFGSRFIDGGSMADSAQSRKVLSKMGTLLANLLLGTHLFDMTSGFQGFHRATVGRFLDYPFRSKAHFYQTELRYLLRKTRYVEIPIHYRAASKSVSRGAIINALVTLCYYFLRRLSLAPAVLQESGRNR